MRQTELLLWWINVFRSRKQIFTLFWHYHFKQQQAFEIYLQYLQKLYIIYKICDFLKLLIKNIQTIDNKMKS